MYPTTSKVLSIPQTDSLSYIAKYVNVSLLFTKTGIPISELPMVITSKDAFMYFINLYTESDLLLCESFYLMALNRSNRVLAIVKHSTGGISSTIFEPRLALKFLIDVCASGLIICHNHPSGNLKPSKEDIRMASKLKEACKLFDILLLDSIIITDIGYYSMADMGEL